MSRKLLHSLRTACLTWMLVAGTGVQATVIEGQHFDDRLRLADTELVLNGVGLRAVAWLKGYAAGLYIAQKASTPEAVIAVKGPKRIRMKMMVEVESKEFVKAFDKGMKRNLSEAEFAVLTDRMAKFDAIVNALVKLKKGDVVDLDYLPARGLVLSLNGVAKGEALPGEDLYAGLLKIFIGTRPVDAKLKAGLLGSA
ncbi:chalcone isomerase family protein [Rhizobacter sp. AJA081-3]|uniref:chalcone isomerase family protein n=1 Tax=Rhizobacter sp. AJA081-3 TaxID=2753607 RepID=UPI001AE0E342|nr:chalcone isomerase family protein [Rhizobacter sp. AJA081-3]QTN21281.1 chalcone isomerase family protein [Rhizobacter sp. AJA081-3]